MSGRGVTQLAPARQSRHHDLTYTHPLTSPSVETSYMMDRFETEVFSSGGDTNHIKISLAIPQTLSHVLCMEKIQELNFPHVVTLSHHFLKDSVNLFEIFSGPVVTCHLFLPK